MKAKFYLLYKHGMEDIIKWPEKWGNTCRGNIAPMLQEVLNTGAVGSEIKLIWNDHHRRTLIRTYGITHQQLEDYLKANTGSLLFQSAGTRSRAIKALHKMGATELYAVDDYKNVMLYQAHFKNHGEFPVKPVVV